MHLFPWTRRAARRQALAAAEARQDAEHDKAVRQLAAADGQQADAVCPYCPTDQARMRRDLLPGHLEARHPSLGGESPWR
jgi:hypothetical protein